MGFRVTTDNTRAASDAVEDREPQPKLFPVREGLCPCCGTVPPLWTPAAIVEAARFFYAQNGRSPGQTDWYAAGPTNPNKNTVYRIFGGFPAMLEAAGLPPTGRVRPRTWTRQRIVEAMLDYLVREGRWPSSFSWANAGPDHPSYDTVRRVFGSMRRAQWEAGRRGIDGRAWSRKPLVAA